MSDVGTGVLRIGGWELDAGNDYFRGWEMWLDGN